MEPGFDPATMGGLWYVVREGDAGRLGWAHGFFDNQIWLRIIKFGTQGNHLQRR
jgi:hypothetical protein